MLGNENPIKYLHEMDTFFKKAGFNDIAMFGLLRKTVMNVLELFQFAVYRDGVVLR